MSEPRISVVMPVFNTEKYLKESIESILNQTFTDFEFIIVDDRSTDSSWQIIQEYATKDSRIIAIKNTGEKGCWSARNFGWNLAKRKYMSLMDSDDIALPQMLQKQFDFMEQNPNIDICGSWIKNFGTNEQESHFPLTHKDIKDLLFFYCCMAQPTVIMRLSSINKLNIRYSKCVAEDYDLWCRIIHKVQFANISEVLLLCRKHNHQMSCNKKTEQDNNAKEIRVKNLEKIGMELSESEQKIYFRSLSNQFVPQNINEIVDTIKIFEKISITGKNFGYGEKFQELIRYFQTKALNLGIENSITSLKVYFSIFRKIGFLETPRANLRYIYHCLRNLLHV